MVQYPTDLARSRRTEEPESERHKHGAAAAVATPGSVALVVVRPPSWCWVRRCRFGSGVLVGSGRAAAALRSHQGLHPEQFCHYCFQMFHPFSRVVCIHVKEIKSVQKMATIFPGVVSLVDGLIDGDKYVRHLLTESAESDINEIKVSVIL